MATDEQIQEIAQRTVEAWEKDKHAPLVLVIEHAIREALAIKAATPHATHTTHSKK